MTKQDMITILMALSKLEGYVIGKTGSHIPEQLANDVYEASEILAKYIKESK